MPKKDYTDSNIGHRLSRSTKLRKYASVYKSYIRKTEQSKLSNSPRRTREPHKRGDEDSKEKTINKSEQVPKSKRKSLNSYQKFVQQESKKDKYNELPGKQRLSAIAAEWKRVSK